MNTSPDQSEIESLLKEVHQLRIENQWYRQRYGLPELDPQPSDNEAKVTNPVDNSSSPEVKIALFASLFQGRQDVYARRWESKASKGYSPVCSNQSNRQLCKRLKVKCAQCTNRSFTPIDSSVFAQHLQDKEVIGIHPLLPNETCRFLVIDLDDGNWEADVKAVYSFCKENAIPIYIERSRSGGGAHIWFFFCEPIQASLARRFGSAILTGTMKKHSSISLKSYDRLIPNQDTMPKGGFGNLIALPLQRLPRKTGNSVFIDEYFEPIQDQWAYLANITRISEADIEGFLSKHSTPDELGLLRITNPNSGDTSEPWVRTHLDGISRNDFPPVVRAVIANDIYIDKNGISEPGLDRLRRLAAFRNPEFYKFQAMRMNTYNTPRIISLSHILGEFLCIPRGCEDDLNSLFSQYGIELKWEDKRCGGKAIDAAFRGDLRPDQTEVLSDLSIHETGVLSATTGFGKTVIGAALIAKHRINTLILVNRNQLVSQWMESLNKFLDISKPGHENHIGTYEKGIDRTTGIIDIAMIQSLAKLPDDTDIFNTYGMVIVDECHHIPAASFEDVLRRFNAKHIYGLTATPARQDGHHPILHMLMGPIRHSVDALEQARKRPFNHTMIPRFTTFRMPVEKDCGERNLMQIYSELAGNTARNNLIADDVSECIMEGRNCIILTERREHVEVLARTLTDRVSPIFCLTGGRSRKQTDAELAKLRALPDNANFAIIATGKYIGEGFDEPRLDTMFIAMPFAWKGTLQQYVGRLHRLRDGKQEVRVYDYVDIHIGILERMYQKRLKGYAGIGYNVRTGNVKSPDVTAIFDHSNYSESFIEDLGLARSEVLIASPTLHKKQFELILPALQACSERNIYIKLLTKPIDDYNEKTKPLVQNIHKRITEFGIDINFISGLRHKFAVIDSYIVWYGSISILGYNTEEESIMHLYSQGLAKELQDIADSYLKTSDNT